ncbi:MAG: hypothetical protein WAU62_06550 [Dehalococcoidales bacterium]|jgi:hypothetical protein
MGINYPDSKDKDSFESGLQFQDFVAELFHDKLGVTITNYQSRGYQFGKGENKQGIEIKLDRDILETNNVSIEIAEKSRADLPQFTPSGIYRPDNSWLYVQGNYKIVFIFAKSTLLLLHQSGLYPDKEKPTVRKFHLPVVDAKRYAAVVIENNTKLNLFTGK